MLDDGGREIKFSVHFTESEWHDIEGLLRGAGRPAYAAHIRDWVAQSMKMEAKHIKEQRKPSYWRGMTGGHG